MSGPFYCGMSFVMILPEYNIRLCGPTSTTTEMEIAHRFSGSDGIILQLNNMESISSHYVRIFSCAWISNHANEEEYLICGGKNRMQIESVRIKATNANFGEYIRSLYYFDCILSGAKIWKDINMSDVGKGGLKLLQDLIEYKLFALKLDYPQYIIDSFCVFVSNKYQILYDTTSMKNLFPTLSQIFVDFDAENSYCSVKLDMLEMFSNLKNVEIIANESIDLVAMLSALFQSKLLKQNQITMKIKAVSDDELMHERSWIYDVYEEITKTEIASKFNIELRKEIIATNKDSKSWDVFIVNPINDIWNCPICYYPQPTHTEICKMCKYSTQATKGADTDIDGQHQGFSVYQHDQYLNHNDDLYKWEIYNQYEIEQQIMDADKDEQNQCIPDVTPIDVQISIERVMSCLENEC